VVVFVVFVVVAAVEVVVVVAVEVIASLRRTEAGLFGGVGGKAVVLESIL
jgi:hypothetical protein